MERHKSGSDASRSPVVEGRAGSMRAEDTEWAAATGIAYITARRQYAAGTLPVPTYRIGRLIMVGEPVTKPARVVAR